MENNKVTVANSAAKKTLTVGDNYKIVFTVSDEDMDNIEYANIYETYKGFNNVRDDFVTDIATSVNHDDENHCYLVTLEGTIQNKVVGEYNIYKIELKNDKDIYYNIKLDPDDYNNKFFVVEQTPTQHLILNASTGLYKVGDTVQLTASLLPTFEQITAVWSSSNEKEATVDENGKVTIKGMGVCQITAMYNGMASTYVLAINASDENEDNSNTDPTVANNGTDVNNGIDVNNGTDANDGAYVNDGTNAGTDVNDGVVVNDVTVADDTSAVSNQNPHTGAYFPIMYVVIAVISGCAVIAVVVTAVVKKKKLSINNNTINK